MFKFFSLSLFCFGVVCAYVMYTIWTVAQLFVAPTCSQRDICFTSYIHDKPNLDLYLYTSVNFKLKYQDSVVLVDVIKDFKYLESWEKVISLNVPQSVRDNGTLYLHVFALPSELSSGLYKQWFKIQESKKAVYFRIKLTQLHVPDMFFFNLLSKEDAAEGSESRKLVDSDHVRRPVTHLKSKVTMNMMTDPLQMPQKRIPQEIAPFMRLSPEGLFLPIMTYNFLETRISDLKLIKNVTEDVVVKYSPTYFGKLRFMVQLEGTVLALKKMGFSERDVDDIKSFFASTNFYLLCLTIIISSFHLLFDFLAFKNDVKFWRNKSTMEGLSFRTVLWRAFTQVVILLYLIDERASLIVLGPSGIGALIEIWKVVKVVRRRNSREALESEKQTNEYDAECMRYLSYLLYPLCILGALYSLFYQPHKSAYSWCIHSLVNGIYAFGFLFMLPQLFVNYRLKSVEALPWRSFMYKAFNTFIDDVFAFIITMPTAHRVACFRDDIIFVIYLYQRWLYPVDKTRIDEVTKLRQEQTTENDKKKN
ncbi:hypothetical protein RUM43_003846 [Polyplax serrata]|uniref:Lipid scramblase CLPTM1L n=1 Tax=Polyplax serrata TaxID=468196 RepID=A0AAN8S8E1_POLSC